MVRSLSLFVLLYIVVAGCSIRNSAVADPVSVGEQAEVSEPVAILDPPVWLNGKPFGTVKDLSKLGVEIKSIMTKRSENADYEDAQPPASNKLEDLMDAMAPVKSTVYLLIDPAVDLETVYRVHKTIEDNEGTVRIPWERAMRDSELPLKPDPFLLSVSIGKNRYDDGVRRLPGSDWKTKISHVLYIAQLDEGNDVTVTRLMGGFEILANGSCVVNDPQLRVKYDGEKKMLLDKNGKPVADTSMLGDFKPSQRKLDRTKVLDEIGKLFAETASDGKIHVMIAVDKKATYASLAPFLELDKDKYFLQISVIGA